MIEAGLSSEVSKPQTVVAAAVSVRRVPVPAGRDRGRGPAVPTVQLVLPRRRRTPCRARCRGRPRHDLPVGATIHAAAGRPMRGLRTDRTAQTIIAGHAFMQNLRRGHFELGIDAPSELLVVAAFNELVIAI